MNLWRTVAVVALGIILSLGTLAQGGTPYGWGSDLFGQLGMGIPLKRNLPSPVADASVFTSAVGGGRFTLAIKADGTCWAWGDNRYGALGDGTTISRGTPALVSGLPAVAQVAAGAMHGLAIATDGTVWAWGGNDKGQSGVLPGSGYVLTPVQVPVLSGVVAVTAGYETSLALKSDGTVWVWGDCLAGQAGDGTLSSRWTPTQVPNLAGVVSIAIGSYHVLAVKSDGSVWAWGGNSYGQVGDGTTTGPRLTPVQVQGLSTAIKVAAGDYSSRALLSGGAVWSWGDNEGGQLATGDYADRTVPTASLVTNAVAIAARQSFMLALKEDGTLWGCGDNWGGQLGNGSWNGTATPLEVSTQGAVSKMAAAWGFTLFLQADGRLLATGDDQYGQLGMGRDPVRWSPTRTEGIENVTALAAGEVHTMALKADGTVWGWGQDADGQLGYGSMTQTRVQPVQASGLSGVTQIAVHTYSSYALREDGTVWSWGSNTNGQLGRDAPGGRSAQPSVVPTLSDVAFIAAGYMHALAVKHDGTLWVWGLNNKGQLGTGTQADEHSPVQVPGISTALMAVGGPLFSLVLLSDGTVLAMGQNQFGQLGDGTHDDHLTPSPVSVSNVTSLAAGTFHALALHTDGTVSAWGRNNRGQLGDGTATERSLPVPVLEISGATALAAGMYHSLVLSGETLWGFGDNEYGAVAQPPATWSVKTPVQITQGCIAMSAGMNFSAAALSCSLSLSATVPASAAMGEPVSFDASLTTYGDCQGSPTFLWAFGDGVTSTEEDAIHTYPAPGTYSWTLTATLGSLTASCGGNITISAPALFASASADHTTGNAPFAVQFTGTGSGGIAPYTYLWDFGDSATSTAQSPSHTYSAMGDYTATLTVRDAANQTATDTVAIHVAVLPPSVTSMAKAASPFRIKVNGSNLQNGVRVFINGAEWTNLKWKSTSLLQIKSGAALKAVVPKGVPTAFRFLNPDGGEVSLVWQY